MLKYMYAYSFLTEFLHFPLYIKLNNINLFSRSRKKRRAPPPPITLVSPIKEEVQPTTAGGTAHSPPPPPRYSDIVEADDTRPDPVVFPGRRHREGLDESPTRVPPRDAVLEEAQGTAAPVEAIYSRVNKNRKDKKKRVEAEVVEVRMVEGKVEEEGRVEEKEGAMQYTQHNPAINTNHSDDRSQHSGRALKIIWLP